LIVRRRLAYTLGALVLGLAAPAGALPALSGQAPTHGPAVPSSAGPLTRGPVHVMVPFEQTQRGRPATPTPGPRQLVYGGGTRGRGVQTHPAVYLVFWGSQWRRADPYVDYEQRFFRGLYRRGDDWTAVVAQYCQGIRKDALACPPTAAHIGRPYGGTVLKGVWFDDSTFALPSDVWLSPGSSVDSVAEEAVRAAEHFGNTKSGANTNVQYVINEPSHYDSAGYGFYCAYHSTVTSNYGTVVYTDLPYLTDGENPTHVGASCGQNAVNPGAGGQYDGVSIVAGHEYVETLTDPFPGYGWLDSFHDESADKCEWVTTGPGRMTDLRLVTGVFAVQSTWSDAAANGRGACVVHASSR
jgi:hypothetical protein